ncbi:PBECR2 nuclease fold domain-containing protein, partial [Campylobacter upsaliensis]
KVLESDLLDKTKPLRKAEKEELTKEVLEQVQKENLKLYLNHTNENLTHFLKLEKPLKITMRGANIKHILNRHGENSTLAKNGQPFVSLEDIKNYDEYINNADKQILKENDKGEKTLLSGKQINGYYIVISSVRLKNGELKLKTMYKENGSLENNEAFKGVKLPSETPSVLQGQSLTTNLDGYPSHAEDIIAQKAKRNFTKRIKALNKVLNLSENEDKIIKEGFFETYGETSLGENLLKESIEENELYVKKLLTQLKELESIDKQSKQYALKLKELDKSIGDYWDNFVGKNLLYSFRGTQNYADHGQKIKELREWGQEKFQSLQNAFKEQIREPFEVLKRENANLSKNVESENEALNKAQKAWLEAFGLKSMQEAYTPKFSKEVNEALEKVLNGEQIKLTKGSYEKLLKRDREEFLPFIKETLENADAVLKDKENALIFVKDIGKKSYFTSVAKNANNEWVISTNSLKTLNTLKNRLNDNGELLYLSKEASNILAEAFTKRAFSNELASESIAQKPQQKALNLQEIE